MTREETQLTQCNYFRFEWSVKVQILLVLKNNTPLSCWYDAKTCDDSDKLVNDTRWRWLQRFIIYGRFRHQLRMGSTSPLRECARLVDPAVPSYRRLEAPLRSVCTSIRWYTSNDAYLMSGVPSRFKLVAPEQILPVPEVYLPVRCYRVRTQVSVRGLGQSYC